jgi:hypothetical protein
LLHLDGIMSSLVLLTLLSFRLLPARSPPAGSNRFGIVAGLSCLSKSPAVILLPFAGLLSLLDLIRSSLPLKDKTAVKQAVWRSAWPLIVFGGMTVAVFALLWPSMWVDPVGTVMRVFDKANHYAAVGHRNPIFLTVILLKMAIWARILLFLPFDLPVAQHSGRACRIIGCRHCLCHKIWPLWREENALVVC